MIALPIADDPLIGYRYGTNGHLEVVGRCEKIKGKPLRYLVKCHVCSGDPEMYGDAIFHQRKPSIKAADIPCGCFIAHNRTSAQYTLLTQREATKRNHTLVSITGSDYAHTAVASLLCEHGHEYSKPVNALLKGEGCQTCLWRNREHMPPHAEDKYDFMATGHFPEGTAFTRIGMTQQWELTCPVCSDDEYVQNGLCSGVFKIRTQSARLGTRPCRCATTPHWTQPQREYQIRQVLKNRAVGTEFVGWESSYTRNSSKLIIKCPEHGNFLTSFHRFVRTKNGCPTCAKGGYDPNLPGVLYVIMARSFNHSFTGYGISNALPKRLAAHRCNLAKAGYEITEMETYTANGQSIKDVELQIMRKFDRHSQCIEGFRKEATHWYNYEEVLDFVESKLATHTQGAQHAC